MQHVLFSYFILLALGTTFYYPTSLFLQKIYAKGYAFSKTVGLLVFGYVYFLSRVIGVNNLFVYAILFLVFVFLIFKRKQVFKLFKKHLKEVVLTEIIFVLCLALFLLFRSINPKIEGIEKFMDFALINSLTKSIDFPFTDVWYATKSLNYYYFGQIIPASVISIFKLNPFYFYNFYISTIFALCFISLVSIGKTLTRKFRYGFLLAFVSLVFGNLDLIVNKIQLKPNYFYASARSLMEYAITEFPSYSFLISDLHAHIINLITVILVLAVCVNIFLSKKLSTLSAVVVGFLLGTMYVTNSWDFIIYTPIVLVTIAIIYKKSCLKEILFNTFIIFLCAGVLFLPFYLTFQPAVSGIGAKVAFNDINAILIMFGYFLLTTIPFVIYYLFFEKKKIDLKLITVLLFIYGIILVFAPNIFFLKDIYFNTNPKYYRANTVFKFWFQAWILFSLSSTLAIYYFYQIKNKSIKIMFTVIFSLVLFSIFLYPVNSVLYIYKTNTDTRFKTLDGSRFLQNQLPNDYKAINWMNKNIVTQANILEKPGDAYTTDSLYSTFTGNPTLIGWINHEYGWRNNWDKMSLIIGDINRIYTSSNQDIVKNLINKYNLEYIIIATKEKDKYGPTAGDVVEKLGSVVYKNNSVKIVKVD